MRWINAHGARTDYSIGDLDDQSNRFANALTGLGINKGDVFFTFLPKMPEQFFAFLGSLKAQLICGTLFSNFGEDALLDLCLKPGWPSMFAADLNNESAYKSKFKYGWYCTGDTARKDSEGYFWFMGRSDDVINTAGHLISPFEVESALLEVEEVAESDVIGAPDELLFEKVVAFVHLHDGFQPTKNLEIKSRLHVSNRASSIATPQEIIFCDEIPKNKCGKIMRRVIKARYLCTDAGYTSTLEI